MLVGAALLLRSYRNVVSRDAGFDPQNVLALRVEPPMASPAPDWDIDTYIARMGAERVEADRFYGQLTGRVRALPGVRGAAAINRRPFSARNWWSSSFSVEGRLLPRSERPTASARVVTAGYFDAFGIPLRSGRVLSASDDTASARVVVLSESAANLGFGNEEPLGRRVTMEGPESPDSAWFTVVGVVGDVPSQDLESAANPTIYTSLAQARFGHFGDWGMDLVVKTDNNPMSVAAGVREIARELNPDLPLFQVQTLEEAAGERLSQRRFGLTLLTLFAGLAVLLTAVGVYAVIAYTMSQRVREIGVRMALGAERQSILRLVLGDGGRLLAAGLACGLLAAVSVAGVMENMLFDVGARDPVTFAEAGLLLAAVALLACALPAWRCSRLDPSTALRNH